MPQFEREAPRKTDVLRVPILPSNSTAPTQVDEVPEYVMRPEITTVSASGTHIDNPSAMSEVTDNHAIEISPYELTSQVTNAASAAATKMTEMSVKRIEEGGVFQQFWSGLLDDVFQGKAIAKNLGNQRARMRIS